MSAADRVQGSGIERAATATRDVQCAPCAAPYAYQPEAGATACLPSTPCNAEAQVTVVYGNATRAAVCAAKAGQWWAGVKGEREGAEVILLNISALQNHHCPNELQNTVPTN